MPKDAEGSARKQQADLAHVLRVRALKEMAAGLAHQLSQPLSAIRNELAACQVQLGTSKPQAVRRILRRASAQAVRAANIVRHFRNLVSKTPPHLRQVNLCDIIRMAGVVAEPGMLRHQVMFRTHLPERPLPVMADRVQIEHLIVNLLQNALEAVQTLRGGRGKRQVQVRAFRVPAATDASDQVKVTIEDSGPGISAETAARLFEPFFTTKAGGLGMGLTIARSIVEAHHGQVWVERRRGAGGTKVCFSLPLLEEQEEGRSRGARIHRFRHRR